MKCFFAGLGNVATLLPTHFRSRQGYPSLVFSKPGSSIHP